MTEKPLFEERVTSGLTQALFVGLTIVFLLLLIWRMTAARLGALGITFLLLMLVFLFYSLNYRTLVIRLSPHSLRLQFGIFGWTVRLDNIEECRLDDLPLLMKYGGAGIHFMLVRRRYRVSFNFLEHPRVVIALRRRSGPVRDVSFSTTRPDELMLLLRSAVSQGGGA
jgi:hypothetical protein